MRQEPWYTQTSECVDEMRLICQSGTMLEERTWTYHAMLAAVVRTNVLC